MRFYVQLFTCITILGTLPVFAEETPVKDAKELRALVIAKREATISAGINGKIDKMDGDIGDRIKKGQVIVSFNNGSYLAEYNKSKADLQEAEKIHSATQQLRKSNAVSMIEITKAEAGLEKAKADLQLKRYYLDESVIHAPYDCRVTKRLTNAHEVVPVGTKLVSIVGDEALRIQALVPSSMYAQLKLKDKISITLDETKQTYTASISHIGAKVDPASQSIEIIADFDKYDPNVIVGMSGAAKIN